jgi:nicotinamide-nucleotide adenylyltransferase
MTFSPGDIEGLRTAGDPDLIVQPKPLPAGHEPGSVGLLAGSFDPMTLAHAALVQSGLRRVDLVVLVYAVRTLPKAAGAPPPLLDEGERIEALRRFCASHPGTALGLSSHGLLADQVAAAGRRFPRSELFVLMGSDKLLQLFDPGWYADRDAALGRLFESARVLVAVRSGDERAIAEAMARPDHARWAQSVSLLDVPPAVAALSSGEVRRRIREGGDVRQLVPAQVRDVLAHAALRSRSPGIEEGTPGPGEPERLSGEP